MRDKEENQEEKKQQKENKDKELKRIAVGNTMFFQATRMILQGLIALQLFKLLQQLLMMIVNAIAKTVSKLIATLLKAINVAKSVVVHVANLMGVSNIVSAMGIVTVTIGTVGCIVSGISNYLQGNKDRYIDYEEGSCAEDAINVASGAGIVSATEEQADVKKLQEECATKVYSVLKAANMSEVNIAGVLGNLQVEGGIDSYAVEGIYGDKYKLTEKKVNAIKDMDYYCREVLKVNKEEAYSYKGKMYCGIGLVQWTGSRSYLFQEFARNCNREWYDIDCQAMFMVDKKKGDTNGALRNWQEEATPEAAAVYVCVNYEKPQHYTSEAVQQPRKEAAAYWYAKMNNGEMQADLNYGESIIKAAFAESDFATSQNIAEQSTNCNDLTQTLQSVENTSIANAAVALCYPYSKLDQAKSNRSDNGTELYKNVHDTVGCRGYNYRECSKYVGTVIAWCGADSAFPANGNSQSEYDHMVDSDRWEQVDWQGDKKKLLPGDILVIPSKHICIYVGNEAISKVYPECKEHPDVIICSASLDGATSNGYPPCCRNWYSDLSNFYAFRCVNPENNTQYQNAGSNVIVDNEVNNRLENTAQSEEN